MENNTKCFLLKVEKFYVRLYIRQLKINKKIKTDTLKHGHKYIPSLKRDASLSWHSLSPEDKQIFIDKYRKWGSNHRAKIADFIKTASQSQIERFIQRRVKDSPDITEGVGSASETIDDANLDLSANLRRNIDECSNTSSNTDIPNFDETMSEPPNVPEMIQSSVAEITQNSLPEIDQNGTAEMSQQCLSEINENCVLEMTQKSLPKPEPPAALNARQLYDLVHRNTEDRTPWLLLPPLHRRHYRDALLKLKKKYLKQYESYLHSLPSEQLYYHMIDVLNTTFQNADI